MNKSKSKQIIDALGGGTAVSRLCECTPQAVNHWFGTDPITGKERTIPKARLMYLKAVCPKVFKDLEKSAS